MQTLFKINEKCYISISWAPFWFCLVYLIGRLVPGLQNFYAPICGQGHELCKIYANLIPRSMKNATGSGGLFRNHRQICNFRRGRILRIDVIYVLDYGFDSGSDSRASSEPLPGAFIRFPFSSSYLTILFTFVIIFIFSFLFLFLHSF